MQSFKLKRFNELLGEPIGQGGPILQRPDGNCPFGGVFQNYTNVSRPKVTVPCDDQKSGPNQINCFNQGGCVYLRIEDIISNPSKTFSISDLEPPKISQKADFEEIPAFEKDIDEILFENKAVKKFLQKHQYHLSEVGKGVFPGTISITF